MAPDGHRLGARGAPGIKTVRHLQAHAGREPHQFRIAAVVDVAVRAHRFDAAGVEHHRQRRHQVAGLHGHALAAGAQLEHLAAELVAHHEVECGVEELGQAGLTRLLHQLVGKVERMEVGTADPARPHPNERLARAGYGIVDFVEDELLVPGDDCTHVLPLVRFAHGPAGLPSALGITSACHRWARLPPMAIDFTLTPELEEIRAKTRDFIDTVVRPLEQGINEGDRKSLVTAIIEMRTQARERGLWCPHMPAEWGGMGLGHVQLAMVQAEAARSGFGPFALNCQAPDEGNMHTLVHWGTEAQKEKYLRPLCDGVMRSCFAMTEPEVAGSDPTLIQTRAYQDGDEWVINGHKWFISGARRANFAILICRTEDNPDLPQAANTAFIIDLPSDGWNDVREIETMHGATGHSEIVITDLRVHDDQMLGGRGQGHLLGQYRLGPARLAHCMRWIARPKWRST